MHVGVGHGVRSSKFPESRITALQIETLECLLDEWYHLLATNMSFRHTIGPSLNHLLHLGSLSGKDIRVTSIQNGHAKTD
jgi:hypothetical protein